MQRVVVAHTRVALVGGLDVATCKNVDLGTRKHRERACGHDLGCMPLALAHKAASCQGERRRDWAACLHQAVVCLLPQPCPPLARNTSIPSHLSLLQQVVRGISCVPPEGGLNGCALLVDNLSGEHRAAREAGVEEEREGGVGDRRGASLKTD